MQVLLVHPPWRHLSGGHLYNLALLDQARRHRFPMRAWTLREGEAPPQADLIFWDSLCLPYLAERPLPEGVIHVLLLHYLPSLDPGLARSRRLALERLEGQALARVHQVLATGPGVAKPLRERYPERPLWQCEPGVDEVFLSPRKRPARSSTGFELVTVANLLPAKGHWELLEVLAGLRRYPWRWHWVGSSALDPAYAFRLRRKIQQLGLRRRIVHHGVLPASRLVELLDGVDWFLFPSRFECFGMALQEAAARQVPMISSRVGAAERWVLPGRTGWLIEPGDLAGFARVLRRCFARPKPRRVWQLWLRWVSSPPTWNDVFQRWQKICFALTQGARR